jgi:uncharacterized protein YecA (UPF0149 family)
MDAQEIMKILAHDEYKFPREALEQAIAKRDEIIPHLLGSLERVVSNPEKVIEEEDYSHLYAIYLLAQFREKRAYPLIVNIASLPAKTVDILLADTITEGLSAILASVCDGDTSLIESLAENRAAEEYVRSAALHSLLVLVACEIRTREEVMQYYASLFRNKLEKEHSFVWDGLISCATDLYPEEVYEDIKKAYENDLADEWVADLDWINKQMTLGKEALLSKLKEDNHLIEDTIQEMEGWAWHTESADSPEKELNDLLSEILLSRNLDNPPKIDANFEENKAQMPYRAPKKVGRNEPCPCGSGKKYKKCCGA